MVRRASPLDAGRARSLFRAAVARLVPLDDDAWARLSAGLSVRRVLRTRHILRAGEICREVAFIAEGLFRTYVATDAGEVTCDLRREGEFVTDYLSFLTGRATDFSIVALENATVLALSRPAMEQLYETLPHADRLGRLIAEHLFVATVERTVSLLLRTPAERYAALTAERPELLQRVQQYHLASYLGVAPETLSRIRRRRAGPEPAAPGARTGQRTATGTGIRPPAKSKAPSSNPGGPKVPRAPREKP